MNTAFFDLETQHSFDQVGGRSHIRDLKLSAAVLYSTADNAYHHYLEADVNRLIADLRSAELVVGFNVVRFDYEVLRAYTLDPLNDLPTVDMLDQIYRKLGFRVSLDNLAGATLVHPNPPMAFRRCVGTRRAASRRSGPIARRMSR